MELLFTAFFGLIAAFFAAIAWAALSEEKHIVCATSGVLSFLIMCVSAYFWVRALVESGKSTFLFGILRYPIEAIICMFLLVFGAYCAVSGFRGVRQGKNTSEEAT